MDENNLHPAASSKPDDPFFSIVIPVYNRFELTENTIRSVLNQTMKKFEIIVVDDGSTDRTNALLQQHFSGEKQFRLVRQQNLERGAARNRGFRESKGKYVVFLDSDDLLLENHLEVVYNKIHMLGFPDFISSKFDFLRDQKRVPSDISGFSEGYYDYRIFLNGNPLACNVCVRQANPGLFLFEEDRAYSIKEDWMFFLQNLKVNKLYLIDQVTVMLLDHPQRSIHGNRQLLIDKTFLSEKWILKNVELSPAEQVKLAAQINYFCAIHSYLDNQKKNGISFLVKAMRLAGIKLKYILLFVKLVIGRRIILKHTK